MHLYIFALYIVIVYITYLAVTVRPVIPQMWPIEINMLPSPAFPWNANVAILQLCS